MVNALSVLCLLPFLVALYNFWTWKRPERARQLPRRLSVLIPARNEARSIERAVQGVLASQGASEVLLPSEVLVYDDNSEDETAEIVGRVAQADARVRLIPGRPLSPGWVGKPHACQVLSEEATGDVLVFLDADVHLEPDGLLRLLGGLEDVDVVTAVPRQITETFGERAIVSLLLLTYLAWLPLRWVETKPEPRFVAANGQLLAIRQDTLRELGGFSSIRGAIVDDVALVRHAKTRSLRARFVDGTHIASCRMYRSFGEVWRGFSKNIAAGLGGSFFAVLGVTSLYALCFVFPYVTLLVGAFSGDLAVAAFGGLGVFLNITLRALIARRYDQPKEQILFHPLAVLLLIALAYNSWSWVKRRKILWAGRVYAGGHG